jgi:para-aminobenzoate synthetase/4-amino-4-deoxychorismate lyase
VSPEAPDPGRGVFETLLVRDGRVQALDAHIERLARSVASLYDRELPTALASEVRGRAGALAGEHRLRVDVVPGDGAVAFNCLTSPLAPNRPRLVSCRPVTVPDGLGAHKWRDRDLLDELADGDAVPLLVDRDGNVLEAASANFWLLDGDRLLTPPADGRLLPGVTRARLLAVAASLGLDPREEPISLTAAQGAAAQVLLTSSLQLAVAATLSDRPAPAAGAGAGAGVERIRAALANADWT